MDIYAKILGLEQELKFKPEGYQGFCGHCHDEPCSCHTEEDKEKLLRLQALNIVVKERNRQIQLWGNIYFKNIHEGICVLGEEYGELCEAVNETTFGPKKRPEVGGKENIIKEASQVAAVAIKIIQMLLEKDIESIE